MDWKSLKNNPYPGRGIIIGSTKEHQAVIAYFIMGRSANSLNRLLQSRGEELFTIPLEEDKIENPELIIYRAMAQIEHQWIVSNGDHTDTILDTLEAGHSFEQALEARVYEPDEPNYTPRIAGLFDLSSRRYKMAILKKSSVDDDCIRHYFDFALEPGQGHLIHTYKSDGNPLPPYEGGPKVVPLVGSAQSLADEIWEALNPETRIGLCVRTLNLETGQMEEKIINRFKTNPLQLKYGLNPNQSKAYVYQREGQRLPFKVINGRPGYINLMDAFNSWQLVAELKKATGLVAAASFKHVSPASAAVSVPLTKNEKRAFFVDDIEGLDDSPIAIAFARARGGDRVCSYGDWIALSDTCDSTTAQIIAREVSDGIIAPGYTDEALDILKSKRKASYAILQMDPNYQPPKNEKREIFGITFEQTRNSILIDKSYLQNIVTDNKDLPESAVRDLLVGMITLKYTQSNSVAFAAYGQAIGVGAGQQSRIHCTRLAASKADLFHLRQHPKVLNLPFKTDLKRAERDNAIDVYLQPDGDILLQTSWSRYFTEKPVPLAKVERDAWLKKFDSVTLASDAFFPFDDNIERAAASGVTYIAQPGGSIRDDLVIQSCNQHQMVMAFTGLRLFHH